VLIINHKSENYIILLDFSVNVTSVDIFFVIRKSNQRLDTPAKLTEKTQLHTASIALYTGNSVRQCVYLHGISAKKSIAGD
jgi:hypothetical protein